MCVHDGGGGMGGVGGTEDGAEKRLQSRKSG